MDLSQLAALPALKQITINNEDITKEYSPDGTPLTFWMLDRQPLAKYLRLTQALKFSENATQEEIEEKTNARVQAVSDLVLKADGTPLLNDGIMLPLPIAVAAYTEVMNNLGK